MFVLMIQFIKSLILSLLGKRRDREDVIDSVVHLPLITQLQLEPQSTVPDSYCLKDIHDAKTLLEQNDYMYFSDDVFDQNLYRSITSKFNNLLHLTNSLDLLYTEVSNFIASVDGALDLESPKITLYGISSKRISLGRFIELDEIDVNLPSTIRSTASTLHTYLNRYEEKYIEMCTSNHFDDTLGNYYERRVRALTMEIHTFVKTLCEIGQLHDQK